MVRTSTSSLSFRRRHGLRSSVNWKSSCRFTRDPGERLLGRELNPTLRSRPSLQNRRGMFEPGFTARNGYGCAKRSANSAIVLASIGAAFPSKRAGKFGWPSSHPRRQPCACRRLAVEASASAQPPIRSPPRPPCAQTPYWRLSGRHESVCPKLARLRRRALARAPEGACGAIDGGAARL